VIAGLLYTFGKNSAPKYMATFTIFTTGLADSNHDRSLVDAWIEAGIVQTIIAAFPAGRYSTLSIHHFDPGFNPKDDAELYTRHLFHLAKVPLTRKLIKNDIETGAKHGLATTSECFFDPEQEPFYMSLIDSKDYIIIDIAHLFRHMPHGVIKAAGTNALSTIRNIPEEVVITLKIVYFDLLELFNQDSSFFSAQIFTQRFLHVAEDGTVSTFIDVLRDKGFEASPKFIGYEDVLHVFCEELGKKQSIAILKKHQALVSKTICDGLLDPRVGSFAALLDFVLAVVSPLKGGARKKSYNHKRRKTVRKSKTHKKY